jgi:hypothetical protein
MEMYPKKRIEVIVEAPLLPRVAARLDDMKVSGYSILPVVARMAK